MRRTIVYLSFWLVAVFVCAVFSVPSIEPGGPNFFAAMLRVFALLSGAYYQAAGSDRLPIFFIYGCVGSLFFVPVFYPHHPIPLASKAAERAADWYFTVGCIVGVVYGGTMCRLVAYWRRAKLYSAKAGPRERCSRCGYLLYGLPEPRCPECGTPFEEGEPGGPHDVE